MNPIPPAVLPWAAVLLMLILSGGIALHLHRRRSVARQIGDREVIMEILGVDLEQRPWLRVALVTAAGGLMALGLFGFAQSQTERVPGGPVVLLLDASASMLTADGGDGISRLQRQRELADRLAESLDPIPVGIVAFAGQAFSLTPPTRDRGAVTMYISTTEPTIVTQSGSAIGAAIRQGLGLLGPADAPAAGTLVLFSDGDETEDPAAATTAARLTRREGAVIHVVGIGSDSGAPVPAFDPARGTVSGFLTGEDGQTLISRRATAFLEEIASKGNGRYWSADSEGVADSIAAAMRRMSGDAVPATGMIWLAIAAILLLIVEPLVRDPGSVR